MMIQDNAANFPRTAIFSAPASSTITKIQIALNNFLIHFPNSVYHIVENAGKCEENETHEASILRSQNIINETSDHLSCILSSITALIPQLPDSTRSEDYYKSKIQQLSNENEQLTNVLHDTLQGVKKLHQHIEKEIYICADTLCNISPV